MAEVQEKSATHVAGPGSLEDSHNDEAVEANLPNSWMYRRLKLGGLKLPWFASPQVQLVLVAFVCFMCPGMFNAITAMGGAGQLDASVADNANSALYSTFAVIGFFAGSITNRMGVKFSLSFGGIGYSIYIASFLCYNHTQNVGFTLFAGAYLGVCAALLWSAQGAIMLAYPPEKSKGRYIAWFWMIFNLGAVIGGFIPLGQNIDNTDAGTVTDGTYVGFLVLTLTGAVIAWTLVDAKKVVRTDGSKVILMKNPTWKSEIKGLWEVLGTDFYIVLLFPMFFASNWFYQYQFVGVNATKFNVRTRALNSVLYWLAQIVGAYIFGYMLDMNKLSRSMRAKLAWGVIFVFTMVLWGGGYDWQKDYTRADVGLIWDWTTPGYAGPMFLYIFYGIYDAAWQLTVYWLMGSLTNNARKLANLAGFYKGIQSAGGAISWRLDVLTIPFMNELASCWALLAGSLVIALPVILLKIKDSTDVEADLAFSDETAADLHIATDDTLPAYEEKV